MSFSIIFCVVFLISLQGGSARLGLHTRIVHGSEARLAEFPYQISLYINDVHECGGSILNENYVLTTAHCIPRDTPYILKVIAGTINIKHLSDSATNHTVTDIQSHEKYVSLDGWNNDIALLKVDPPFKFNKYIAPAILPRANETVNPEQMGIISGFGRTKRHGKLSPKLLKTKVFTVDLEYCQSKHEDTIRPTNVCTLNAFKDTGFCKGDSGGPLTVKGKVVGIVSFSRYGGCATSDERLPQVFTKVSAYIDWISAHMDKNNFINN